MTSCFRKANSTSITETSTVDGACSLITTSELVSPCCPIKPNVQGAGNLCLSDYLCYETGPPSGGSGFLTASCTDQTYASGECTEHCADNPVPDVIYNPDTGLWACCSWSYAGGVDCANPTTESWAGIAPQVLLDAASSSSSITGTATATVGFVSSTSISASAITSIPSSSSTTYVNTATSSQPYSASSSTSTSSISTSSLTTGAKAGIAIGVTLGVLFLALAFFLVWRAGKRSRQRHVAGQDMMTAPVYQQNAGRGVNATKYGDYSLPAVEMHSNSTSELPAHAPRGGGRGGLVELQ